MTPPTATSERKLSTAEERREELLQAAVKAFAEGGYGAPTMKIAEAAGISQAYLFRLFPTKTELFVGVCAVARQRLLKTFRDAAAAARAEGLDPLERMGKAYADLLETDRDVLRIQLHSEVAAGAEPEVRAAVRRTFRELYELVEKESGAPAEDLKGWFAHGMLCNTMAAIDAEQVDEPWAHALTKSDEAD